MGNLGRGEGNLGVRMAARIEFGAPVAYTYGVAGSPASEINMEALPNGRIPNRLTKMGYTHEALLDQIIANPQASNDELGRVFGYTGAWIGRIKSSGIFREKMVERRGEIVDPVLSASVEERLEMVTNRSLEVLMQKLEKPVDLVPDNLVLAAAALGAKGMGVGGFSNKPVAAPPPPDEGRIERLAARLMALNRGGGGEIVDVEAKDVS